MHRARLKLSKTDVAVKVSNAFMFSVSNHLKSQFVHNELGIDQVQHPGAEHLMMVDIRNMQAMALFLQKYDINFDLFSATKEMEKQVLPPTQKHSILSHVPIIQYTFPHQIK